MLNESAGLLVPRGGPAAAKVVLHSQAYVTLMTASRVRMPAPTTGVLVGSTLLVGSQEWVTVKDVVPLQMVQTEYGPAPDRRAWDALQGRLSLEDLSIVGSFTASQGAGPSIPPPGTLALHAAIAPDAELLLVVDTSADQGAFGLLRDGAFLPLQGFYEALPEQASSAIPWTGQWLGGTTSSEDNQQPGTQDKTSARAPGMQPYVPGRAGRAKSADADAEPEIEEADSAESRTTEEAVSARPSTPAGVYGSSLVEEAEQDELGLSQAIEQVVAAPSAASSPSPTHLVIDIGAVRQLIELAAGLEADGHRARALETYRLAAAIAPIGSELAYEVGATVRDLESRPDLPPPGLMDTAPLQQVESPPSVHAEAHEAAQDTQAVTTHSANLPVPVLPGMSPDPAEAEIARLYDAGLAAFSEGRLKDARDLLAEVVHRRPDYRRNSSKAANLLAGVENRLRGRSLKKVTRSYWAGTLLVAVGVLLMLGVAAGAVSLFTGSPTPTPGLAQPPTSVSEVLPLASNTITPPTPTAPRSVTFPETGKKVTVPFLDYWESEGGVYQFGFPISEEMEEVSDVDGKSYRVQYFERALFEWHPENEPEFRVQLAQLGTLRYNALYPDSPPVQTPNRTGGSILFAETGRRLGGLFLQHWERTGGIRQHGLPITDEFLEQSTLDGKPYRVQYFERSVLELHPENPPPGNVLASQLGTFRYREKYPGR